MPGKEERAMDEKRNDILTIGILFAILLVFGVVSWLKPTGSFSETENRILSPKPSISGDALFSGEYAEAYETYLSDQFVGREKWVGIKTWTDILLQKKEINGVYLGRDGYLIEKHDPDDYRESRELPRIVQLEKLVRKWDARVMLIPGADNVLADKMPGYAESYDQSRLLAIVKERVGDANYVDVEQILKEHATEEIYYRTDHHWTSLGAYYGYLAWADIMKKAPVRYGEEEAWIAAEEFYGGLYTRIQTAWRKDTMYYYPETEERGVEIIYDFAEKADSFYAAEQLQGRNPYGFFMDDTHAFAEIHTGACNNKSLFVIKDSYANCIIPMLAGHYEHIYVLDLSYFNGQLFDFMEKYISEGDDVLVVYGCMGFLESFKYNK